MGKLFSGKNKSKRIRWEQTAVYGQLFRAKWVFIAIQQVETVGKVGDERNVPRIVSRNQFKRIQIGQ
jgi:hypothetical protein